MLVLMPDENKQVEVPVENEKVEVPELVVSSPSGLVVRLLKHVVSLFEVLLKHWAG